MVLRRLRALVRLSIVNGVTLPSSFLLCNGNVVALADNLESKLTERTYNLAPGRVLRETGHGLTRHVCLRYERLDEWRLAVHERIATKRLDMERNRRVHIVKRRLIAVEPDQPPRLSRQADRRHSRPGAFPRLS